MHLPGGFSQRSLVGVTVKYRSVLMSAITTLNFKPFLGHFCSLMAQNAHKEVKNLIVVSGVCTSVSFSIRLPTLDHCRARLEQLCVSTVLLTIGCKTQRSPRHFSLFLGFKTNLVLAERPLKIEMGIFLTSV